EWKVLIENQTVKKIKKLRTDNGLEFCRESFNALCRKYGIARHHTLVRTPQQNGVAERMNRTIMEKVRCMLSHANLDKDFWVEAATTASYLINRSPHRSLDGNIPEILWSGNSVDYSNLRVFGCPVYVHVNEGKLVPRAVKCIFLGYGSGVKGYRVWCPDPKYRKIIHSRDVTFNEDVIINSGKDFVPPHNVDNNHTEGKVEFEFDVENSTHTQPPFNDEHIETQDDGNMPTSPQSQPQTEYLLARDRERRQVNRPPRLKDYQCDLVAYAFAAAAHIEGCEPTNYFEAISSPECDKWVVAMEEEVESLHKNETWELVKLPKEKRVISCKWLFKVKDGIPGVESKRYKARYVVRGFDQREGIDFNEVFSHVVHHTSIRVLLSIIALQDLELEQLCNIPYFQCYTEKLDALRRWREMFFWVDDALVPWDFAFYTQGSLPRDERPPPGSYSIEDAELINENRIPINAYSEAFLCHMGISRNYFQSPEEVPTFIGDDGRGGCLSFLLPRLMVRSRMESYLAGRTRIVLEQQSGEYLTPLRSVPGATAEPPRLDATSVGSSEDADVAGAESEAGEVDSGLKRKRATSDDGAGTSKRVRHVSLGLSTSTEEETPDAPPTLAAKEVTETPPPNVEATSDSSAPVTHAAQSPPQTSPLTADDISRRGRETGPKAFESMPVDQLMEEFDMVTAQQAALVAQLRARFSNERSQSIQKDEEILLLKTQLADAQAEAESSRSYAQNLAEEKMALLVKVEQERADAAEYKASCHWAVKYLEGGKNNHFAGLDEFRQRVEGLLEKQEEKLRKLSIEYDEELYPHMLSAIAERRWLISHGLRLAAMSTLESQEVKQSFGDVVKCALARGKAEAVEELHEKRLLTVPAAQVPGYNDKAYEELVAAMEAMKLLELPHIAQLERDQDYPIDVIMAGLTLARHASEGAEGQPDYFLKPDVAQLQVPIFSRPRDILNPFALEREIPLKESLEAHAIRLAKKKGVKGKAILCGVGAAHIPRSDGVPVSVATVLPKDSELLGKLEEAGDAAYQVGRSEQSRCHSI
ncbi:gypsy type transposase, partial [Tanacetum coccineum]